MRGLSFTSGGHHHHHHGGGGWAGWGMPYAPLVIEQPVVVVADQDSEDGEADMAETVGGELGFLAVTAADRRNEAARRKAARIEAQKLIKAARSSGDKTAAKLIQQQFKASETAARQAFQTQAKADTKAAKDARTAARKDGRSTVKVTSGEDKIQGKDSVLANAITAQHGQLTAALARQVANLDSLYNRVAAFAQKRGKPAPAKPAVLTKAYQVVSQAKSHSKKARTAVNGLAALFDMEPVPEVPGEQIYGGDPVDQAPTSDFQTTPGTNYYPPPTTGYPGQFDPITGQPIVGGVCQFGQDPNTGACLPQGGSIQNIIGNIPQITPPQIQLPQIQTPPACQRRPNSPRCLLYATITMILQEMQIMMSMFGEMSQAQNALIAQLSDLLGQAGQSAQAAAAQSQAFSQGQAQEATQRAWQQQDQAQAAQYAAAQQYGQPGGFPPGAGPQGQDFTGSSLTPESGGVPGSSIKDGDLPGDFIPVGAADPGALPSVEATASSELAAEQGGSPDDMQDTGDVMEMPEQVIHRRRRVVYDDVPAATPEDQDVIDTSTVTTEQIDAQDGGDMVDEDSGGDSGLMGLADMGDTDHRRRHHRRKHHHVDQGLHKGWRHGKHRGWMQGLGAAYDAAGLKAAASAALPNDPATVNAYLQAVAQSGKYPETYDEVVAGLNAAKQSSGNIPSIINALFSGAAQFASAVKPPKQVVTTDYTGTALVGVGVMVALGVGAYMLLRKK